MHEDFLASLQEDGVHRPPSGWPRPRIPELIPAASSMKVREIEFSDGVFIAEDATKPLGPDWKPSPFPEEFYLRDLPKLDLYDDEVIADLVQTYGFLLRRNLPYQQTTIYEALDFFAWGFFKKTSQWKKISNKRTQLQDELGPYVDFELLDESRLLLFHLRDLSALWLSYVYTGEMAHPLLPWEVEYYGLPRLTEEGSLRIFFEKGLSGSLCDIRFAYELAGGSSIEPVSGRRTKEHEEALAAWDLGLPGLYSLIGRQIHNHVVERARFKKCANEKCQQIFVRQVRDHVWKYEPNSEGLKYCSRRCATRTAKRRSKKKKRDEERAKQEQRPSQERTHL